MNFNMPLELHRKLLSVIWYSLLLVTAMLETGVALSQDRPAISVRDSVYIQDLVTAIQEGESLIARYPDSDFSPSVMFQLVELYVKQSAFDFQQKMSTYDRTLARYDAGELSTEPVMPRIGYRQAVEMGYRILQQYPTAPFNDRVVYRIAVCHLEEGNSELARDYFQKILSEYPKSAFLLEANFRLGEYYFDKRNYVTAVEYYSKLLNNWQNPFYNMALYKLAWSYYNQDNFAKAISTFIYLIDDLNMVEDSQAAEVLGKTKADLRQESIEYVAQSFAEYGGPQKVREFLAQFSDKEYGIEIFLKLGELYQKRNYYNESIETLEIALELWPLYAEAPLLQNKIIENYISLGEEERAELARAELVRKYGPGSAWLKEFSDDEHYQTAYAMAEENLYILGTEAQARAQQQSSVAQYRTAIERYLEYEEKFADAPNAAKVVYYLAESYYDIKDFGAAAEAYYRVLTKYPDSEHRDDAAYNRILSHFEELKGAPSAAPSTFVLSNFLGTRRPDSLSVPNEIYPKLLTACNDFVVLIPTSSRLPEVLMKYGETLFNLQEFSAAQQVYGKAILDLPGSPYVVQAHLLYAQCALEKQDYLEAEKWARKVVVGYPDSVAYVDRANKMISSTKFKLAETFKDKGNHSVAGQAFENIAASSQDSTIAEVSLAEAATQYEEAGNKLKAIETYEKFYLKFPGSAKVDEALYRAAILSEEEQKWTRASQNYLALVSARPESPYVANAVYSAARCYDHAGLAENALKTYDRYLADYHTNSDQYMEALCRAGEICFNRKDFPLAEGYYERAIRRFEDDTRIGQSVDAYLAAQAQFMLGEIHFERYRLIELVAPMEASLKAKQAHLNDVLTDYKNAALFQIGEWTVAASHKIGAAFEEFGRFFWESERPELSEDLMIKFEDKLQEKVRPFKERAYETYTANLKQAHENGINNDWVQRSKERANVLAAELGISAAFTELMSGMPGSQPQPLEIEAAGTNGSATNGHTTTGGPGTNGGASNGKADKNRSKKKQ